MWLVIQVVYFRSCPDCLTVASYKGRSNYDTDSNHPVFMFTYSAKAEFCFKKKIDQKKREKENWEKELFPRHSWGKKQQQPYLNTFLEKLTRRGIDKVIENVK